MNTVLWILQGILALIFVMAGFMKLGTSRDELRTKNGMEWVEDVSSSSLKLIGLVELLAAIGLILPHLTGILPWLTPAAALGLILTMVGAMFLHLRRGDEFKALSKNIILALLAAAIAYGRFLVVRA